MRKRAILILAAGLVVIGVIAILARHPDQGPLPGRPDKLQVTASFYPLYFFASVIGGNKAEVTNMTPAGAEPHDYEPTARDMARIEKSRLLVLNGGGLEAWGASIRKNIDPGKTHIVTAGEGLANQRSTGEGEARTDPHIWLSPLLAKEMAERIARGFERADPPNKDYYRDNAITLKARLADLDKAYRQGLSACAERDIITSHAAFGYLASAYGLRQVPIAGLSPDAEPSPLQMAKIVRFARDNHVRFIFFESLVSPKLAKTIANEAGAQTLVLNPIEGLSSEEIASGRDYFTEMQTNLMNLKKALGCR